jgi:hypothetical protein
MPPYSALPVGRLERPYRRGARRLGLLPRSGDAIVLVHDVVREAHPRLWLPRRAISRFFFVRFSATRTGTALGLWLINNLLDS